MPFDSHSPHDSARWTRLAILLTAAVTLALLLLPQARALAGEVHFDSDSPAGKEYALPLDQARDEAAGVGKSDGPAGEKAPLFGEGVSSGGGGASGGGSPGADRTGDEPAGQNGREPQGSGSTPSTATAAAIASASSDNGYDLSSGILWILAVVALGGIAGLVLRGFQRPSVS